MHRMIKTMERRELFARQLPIGTSALVTAELFYRFHSFTLECLAFLATWYALDRALDAVSLVRPRRGSIQP